jgi:RHS repeat-associated protein
MELILQHPEFATATFYVRDASGNVMAVYKTSGTTNLSLEEQHIYGSSRLGIFKKDKTRKATTRALGERQYELTDHLGNVRVVLSDYKKAESIILSATDYYPFGMVARTYTSPEEYRYGFNGQEKETEWNDNYSFTARMYDPRIGRLLSVDPLTKDYPWYTPYQFAGNTPIQAIDLLGEQPAYIIRKWTHSENYGGLYSNNPEYHVVLKDVQANTVNVSALLQNEDVHGGTLEVTYTPEGKLVSAKWTGYKEKSFIDKNFTASAYGSSWEGNSNGAHQGGTDEMPDGVTINLSFTAGGGAVGSQGLQIGVTGEGVGSWWNSGAGAGLEWANASLTVNFLYKTKDLDTPIPLQDISRHGKQISGGWLLGTAGYGQNSATPGSLTPSSYVSFGGGISIGADDFVGSVTGSVQTTYSQPLFMIDKNQGCYVGQGKDEITY